MPSRRDRLVSGVEIAGWQRGWSLFLQPFYDLTYVVALVGALQVWRAARRDAAGTWRR